MMKLILFYILSLSFGATASPNCQQWFENYTVSNSSARLEAEQLYSREVKRMSDRSELKLFLKALFERKNSQASLLKHLGFKKIIRDGEEVIVFPESILECFHKIDRFVKRQINQGIIAENETITPGITLTIEDPSPSKRNYLFLKARSKADFQNIEMNNWQGDLDLKVFAEALAAGTLPVNFAMIDHDFMGHQIEFLLRPEVTKRIRKFYQTVAPLLTRNGTTTYDEFIKIRSLFIGEFLSLPDLSKQKEIEDFSREYLPQIEDPNLASVLRSYRQKLATTKDFTKIEYFLNTLPDFLTRSGGALNDGRPFAKILDNTKSEEIRNLKIRLPRMLKQLRESDNTRIEVPIVGVLSETLIGLVFDSLSIIKLLKSEHPQSQEILSQVSQENLKEILAYKMGQIHLQLYWGLKYKITDLQIIEASIEDDLPISSPIKEFFEKTQSPGSHLYEAYVVGIESGYFQKKKNPSESEE